MNKLSLCILFILTFSLIFGGIYNTSYAQNDPSILLKIAKQAQEQLRTQIDRNSTDTIHQLFNNGTQQVTALENSLGNNQSSLAQQYFLSAMRYFTQVSQQLAANIQPETTLKTTGSDQTVELLRTQGYYDNLKAIAKKYNALIDTTQLDELFSTAKKQISDKQFDDSSQTISKIKLIIVDLNKNIREQSSQNEQTRAKDYAQIYIEQLDRLIENAKNQELSDDIIQKLVTARENLSLATNPHDIINQVREIISIKKQFELTKNDRLESRVMQIEKMLVNLSESDKINQSDLEDAQTTIQTIKRLLSENKIDMANELLRSLATILQ